MVDPAARDTPLTVLIAPDSFKGSLTSVAVAAAISAGWARARPWDHLELAPLADGGEGTLDAIAAAGGWDALPAHAEDPLGRPLEGRFLRRGPRAVVELATASGLSRLTSDERDALMASTFGTGQILATCVALGARDVVLGLGGSATTDGGAGLLRALGARFLDERGHELAPGGGPLGRLAAVDLSGLSPVLGDVTLTIASAVRLLDANLSHYADMLERATGRDVRTQPGAGAAGGTTAGLLAIEDAFAGLRIRPGVEVVMELTDFDARLERADLVITGEGRIDEQTAFGKTALGVARRASAAGKRCLAFAGGVTVIGSDALMSFGAVAVPVAEGPISIEEAMAAGPGPVERAAERVARLLTLARP